MNLLENITCQPLIESQKYFFNGVCVPRATEILSLMNDPYITTWANNIGFRHKKYEEELDKYAEIGTIVHDLCDKHMLGEDVDISNLPRELVNSVYNCISGFKLWWKNLNDTYSISVISIEQELVCQYYGGTCDVILNIDGRNYLGDFKTSKHIGYKYWCQLAAYINILESMGIHISGCFILQLSKTKTLYNDYVLNFDNINDYNFIQDCYNTFCGAVYTYYNRLSITQQMESVNFNKNYTSVQI